MNTIPYGTPQPDFESYEEESFELSQRPRRRFWGPATAALITVIAGAICFYAGVRVEKGQTSSSSTAAAGALARLAGAGATGASGTRAGAGAGASGAAGAAGTGAAGSGFGGGFGRFAGGAGGGNNSFGTVSAIDGQTLYVTGIGGNTTKVTLSSATKITKSQSASASDVRPGDSVVISGIKGSGGTIAAATVSDSGVRTTGSGSGASGSGGSSGSGSTSSGSAVNSLFGGGGG